MTSDGPSRQDDPAIPDEENLYRYVFSAWIVVQQCDAAPRLSSIAFKERNGEISVDVASLTTPAGSLARASPHAIGLVAVTAGCARELAQAIVSDPIVNQPLVPDNPAHALICGRQPKSVQRKLAQAARWVHPPEANPFA